MTATELRHSSPRSAPAPPNLSITLWTCGDNRCQGADGRNKKITTAGWNYKLARRFDDGLLKARAEKRTPPDTVLSRRILSDHHVVTAGGLWPAVVIHPARLQKFELLFNGALDA